MFAPRDFLFAELGVLNWFREGVAVPPTEPVGELADLDVSGVTFGALMPGMTETPGIRGLSGVGRFGEFSVEEMDSDPELMKLFISDSAGASTPGSLDVKAFTAG